MKNEDEKGFANRLQVKKFIEDALVAMTRKMMVTGEGYHRESLRNTGKGDDRRKDKLEDGRSKQGRAYLKRYGTARTFRSDRHAKLSKG
jgi:hypothetical protein